MPNKMKSWTHNTMRLLFTIAFLLMTTSSSLYGDFPYVAELAADDGVTLHNPWPQSVAVDVYLFRRAGNASPLIKTVTVLGGSIADLESLIAPVSGSDLVVIHADRPLLVFRPPVWAPLPAGQRFGFGEPVVIGRSSKPIRIGRTSATVVNLSPLAQTFEIHFYRRDGASLASRSAVVAGFGSFEVQPGFDPSDEGFMILRATSPAAQLLAYGMERADPPRSITAEALFSDSSAIGSLAGPRRNRLVRPVDPASLPTSTQLIDQARTRGEISEETALIYKVYALFEDARLPLQYRGVDRDAVDSLILTEVVGKWEALSDAAKQLLTPFLIPPHHAGSWYDLRTRPASLTVRVQAEPPIHCGSPALPWESLPDPPIPQQPHRVKIWYRQDRPDAKLKAQELMAEVPHIWDELTGLMERTPEPDRGSVSTEWGRCRGGDDRVDVSVLDVPRSYVLPFVPGPCKKTAAFIVIDDNRTPPTLAHEFMHVLQYTYNVAATPCLYPEEYGWWVEASATWAQHRVYPTGKPFGDSEHVIATAYLTSPEISLDTKNNDHEYGAYLWPFFLHRKFGDEKIVKRIWDNTESADSLQAIETAIEAHGKFEKVWPQFALAVWNQLPVEDFKTWDSLNSTAKARQSIVFELTEVSDFEVPMESSLPHLASAHFNYHFMTNARSVAFINGTTFKLSKKVPEQFESLGTTFVLEDLAEKPKGAYVQGAVKVPGQWKETQPWNDIPVMSFCNDERADSRRRVAELLVVVSNSEYKDRTYHLTPAGLPPTLFVSNMGCWKWEGDVSFRGSNIPLDVRWRLTFTRLDADLKTQLQLPFPEFPIMGYQYWPEGTGQWSVSGTVGGCTYSGGGSMQLDRLGGGMFTFNFVPKEGALYRSYSASAVGLQVNYTVACPSGTTTHGGFVPAWNVNPLGEPPTFHVSRDGRRMEGQMIDDEGTWEWILRAVPE